MTRSELLDFHLQMCNRARAIMQEKNHDYSGTKGDDPFGNFRMADAMGITTTLKAMLVRMTDKFKRLTTFSDGPLLVKDEKVEDTCDDLVNYAILFAAFVKEMRHVEKLTAAVNEASCPIPTKELLMQIMSAMQELSNRVCDGQGTDNREDTAPRRSAR